MDELRDTIAAVATGQGVSAIGVVRLSGSDSIAVAEKLTALMSGTPLSDRPQRTLNYCRIIDVSGETLDTGLVTFSRAPSSYTGEDTAEIQCHGSPVVMAEILRTCFAHGARQALPGEFTKRAFLNGRLDLTQAEAVIDVIEAQTAELAKNAAGQLIGALGKRADAIFDSLLEIVAHFYAVVDYPDEDIDEFELKSYIDTLTQSETRLKALCDTFDRGRIMKDGVLTAIIGRPNAGKSSLLNTLVGFDRAIVTSTPGATRDTVEEKIRIGGTMFRLTDTAGIRDAHDEAESLGVERAIAAAKSATLVIAVFDGSTARCADDDEIIQAASDAAHKIAVINKNDLDTKFEAANLDKTFDAVCSISLLTGDGVDNLLSEVSDLYKSESSPANGEVLTNARQADAASSALTALITAKESMRLGVTPDAVLSEIESALSHLGELTGKNIGEEVLKTIFSRFCVGK